MTTARERIEQLHEIYKISPHIIVETETIRELLAELDRKCLWTTAGTYPMSATGCGERYPNIDGWVFKFCPHCGKEIVTE